MDGIIPWDEWVGVIQPFCCKGQRGRPPKGVKVVLRMYLLQCGFRLTDEGVEDAIYDSYAFRKFMGINFMEQDVPDATTLLYFRHLLEGNGLNKLFFDAINRVMVAGVHRLSDQPPSQEFAKGVRQGDRLRAAYRASKVLCALQGGACVPHHQAPV